MRRTLCVLVILAVGVVVEAQEIPATEVADYMKQAARYLDENVATRGGYLWRYTSDLSRRWGEGKATEDQVWVQAGTPMMGLIYLKAYEASGDEYFLDLAKKAADALVWGQLECGGWFYHIDFSQQGPRKLYYRHMKGEQGVQNRYNHGIFDDNTTQSAMRLLMKVDRAHDFQDPYHDAAMHGLEFMLQAQFDNGAWPQRYPYSRTHYDRYYTFNDNAINDCIEVMLMAWDIYAGDRYLQSALDAGDFIIASQLEPPQSGWAQQYDWDMEPAPARRFEPKSLCPAATSRNIRTLVKLYARTGLDRFLEPVPATIEWLQSCKIEEELWPRFVEIGSNRPLYFTKDYELVYTDEDLPTHYSFQGSYGIPASIDMDREARELGPRQYYATHMAQRSPQEAQAYVAAHSHRIREIIETMDEQGRWLRDGEIVTRVFSNNIRALSAYVRSRSIAAES